VKVGDLVTWRNPREKGKSDFKGYGLIISAEMMGQPSDLRLWLIVKWSNGKTESVPQWLLASRVKVISESR
jgi:hypothetical protein